MVAAVSGATTDATNLPPSALAPIDRPPNQVPRARRSITVDELQMDQIASVLLNFPPAGGIADDDLYNSAAKSHSQSVDKLAVTPNFKDTAAQLLDVRESCPSG